MMFHELFHKKNLITYSLLHTLFEIVFSKHNYSSCDSVCMMGVQYQVCDNHYPIGLS